MVRAEKGENITLDTLRKIAAYLPLENLTLLEKLKLDFDYIPEPQKLYLGALSNISHALEALRSAVEVAKAARMALAAARRADPHPTSEGMNKVDGPAASEDHRMQHRRRRRQAEGDRLRVWP